MNFFAKINKAKLNLALVKTGHGGLYIYCYIDPLIIFAKNSMVKNYLN